MSSDSSELYTTTDARSAGIAAQHPDNRDADDRDAAGRDGVIGPAGTSREQRFEGPDGHGYLELYVIPDPTSTKHLVFVLSEDEVLHHVGTFDTADFEDDGIDVGMLGLMTGASDRGNDLDEIGADDGIEVDNGIGTTSETSADEEVGAAHDRRR